MTIPGPPSYAAALGYVIGQKRQYLADHVITIYTALTGNTPHPRFVAETIDTHFAVRAPNIIWCSSPDKPEVTDENVDKIVYQTIIQRINSILDAHYLDT